jgi:UDPglucose--hexose-1-phosphate uridylyltransferase
LISNNPHKRLNPLTGEWVLVSPQRSSRPWIGQVEALADEKLQKYDPECYLCPGNKRAGGVQNPVYSGTYTFDNDFAALIPSGNNKTINDHPLFQSYQESGICRVVCFSPHHDLTIPELPLENVIGVIQTWCDQSAELFHLKNITHVQVFENKGAVMGCSNPHPHSQIWAQVSLPNEPAKEYATQQKYFKDRNHPLLMDYLDEELIRAERIVVSNDHFTALVPFWAIWPFEIMVIAHRQVSSLPELSSDEIIGLADIYRKITIRFDNLFGVSFPYSMGFHQAPNDGTKHPEWILHAHFYPPLLRSATIRKYMVGFEMLAMPQRDISPELAAERLRSLPDVHYKQKPD